MHKKGHKLKTSSLVKNPQFSSNLADIQAKLPTHKAIILTKFHKECKKIVDFSFKEIFWLVPFFMHHPLFISKSTDLSDQQQLLHKHPPLVEKRTIFVQKDRHHFLQSHDPH